MNHVSSNYENTTKTVTADLTTTVMLRRILHMMKKSRSLVKTVNTTLMVAQTMNWIRILTETTWHSKAKYPSLALLLNIPFLLLIFIGFNCCNVQFGIAFIITIIIVWAIVNVGLLFTWSCMCLINTLDDCDLPEKVVNITNVHEHNDVIVSTKVQQSRSRYAKYVYYNCTQQEMKSIA